MSAKTTASRDQIAAQIAEQLMAKISAPSTVSLTDKLLRYASDKIADAGNGVAEITAGFSAMANNYAVHREAAAQRQAARTAGKVAALVEAELKARGL